MLQQLIFGALPTKALNGIFAIVWYQQSGFFKDIPFNSSSELFVFPPSFCVIHCGGLSLLRELKWIKIIIQPIFTPYMHICSVCAHVQLAQSGLVAIVAEYQEEKTNWQPEQIEEKTSWQTSSQSKSRLQRSKAPSANGLTDHYCIYRCVANIRFKSMQMITFFFTLRWMI